jgi:hypothetical protein
MSSRWSLVRTAAKRGALLRAAPYISGHCVATYISGHGQVHQRALHRHRSRKCAVPGCASVEAHTGPASYRVPDGQYRVSSNGQWPSAFRGVRLGQAEIGGWLFIGLLPWQMRNKVPNRRSNHAAGFASDALFRQMHCLLECILAMRHTDRCLSIMRQRPALHVLH